MLSQEKWNAEMEHLLKFHKEASESNKNMSKVIEVIKLILKYIIAS